MNCFGNRSLFAIEYENCDEEDSILDVWIENKPICRFYRNGILQKYKWNLTSIVEWFEQNIEYIVNEEKFPLPINANSSIEFYNKSSGFDSEDMEEFDKWYITRQDWCFRHSWFINRNGSFLPEVFFRRVNGKIEIEWDNSCTYNGITYEFPKGIFYIDIQEFCHVINGFISYFKEFNM